MNIEPIFGKLKTIKIAEILNIFGFIFVHNIIHKNSILAELNSELHCVIEHLFS